MKDVYICSTPYHIYISFLLIFSEKKKSSIYLTTSDKDLLLYFNYLSKNAPYSDLFEIKVRNDSKRNNIFDRLTSSSDINYLNELKKESRDIRLSIFPWNPYVLYTISQSFFKSNEEIRLIEDGANVYAFPKPKFWKLLAKRILFGYDLKFYNNENVKEILVQFPEKYTMFPKEKLRKLELKTLEKNLSISEQHFLVTLFSKFDFYSISKSKKKVNLVLTQPLSEDGYISEEEKIRKYSQIIESIDKDELILIKKHPRDKTNYLFKNVIELERQFPSELFNLVDIKFQKVITICSSAVDNLDAKEKIQTEPYFLQKMRS